MKYYNYRDSSIMPENLIEQGYTLFPSMVSKNRYHIQILCGKTLIVKAFSHESWPGVFYIECPFSTLTSTNFIHFPF